MSDRTGQMATAARVEWPTLALIAGCYGVLGLALFVLPMWAPVWVAVLVLGPAVALHASLTHEVVHGHPFRAQWLNAALVFPAVTLVVPYARFRATHLAHHQDERLTDPYDDPESNYLDPAVWGRLTGVMRAVLAFNNRLVGRLSIGPIVGQVAWMVSDWRAWRAGDGAVFWGWAVHIPAVAVVVALVWVAPLSGWAFLAAVYLGLSLLRLRTYLEHRAHEKARARTVIVEDRGPLAFLFLNNNLHVVHHMHPKVPWYELPGLYGANRAHYLRRNEGYLYRSYGEVLRRYFWRGKDPVAHPLWRGDER